MMTLDEFFDEQMKDPAFVEAWEELQPEMNVMRANRPIGKCDGKYDVPDDIDFCNDEIAGLRE